LHALTQQKPSAQNPLAQTEASAHAAPFDSLAEQTLALQ
jgi:hypothetical protein